MCKKTYIAIAAGLFLAACSEDTMDRINKNVNDPTSMASMYILTDNMTSSAFSITGSDLAFYASSYIEHNVGIYNQLYNAEIRVNEPYASSTYNNSWGKIYENLYELKEVISKCSAGGSEAGNYLNLGIARVLTAYDLAILTDEFGDVPWTEALQPGVIFQPKLDSQESIYQTILTLLDSAIVNLSQPTTYPNLGEQDLIYNGNAEMWTKAAYGLKARYLMRLSFRNPQYAQVLTAIESSFTSANDEFIFNKYDGSIAISPFYAFFVDRDYFGASESLHNKLVARNDLRDSVFFKPYETGGDLLFAPNGNPTQQQGLYAICALTSPTAPTYLMSYHELLFLKAEAQARSGKIQDADTTLQQAITVAFAKVGLTAADAQEYYTNNIKALFDANPTQEIAIQKYISFFQSEALEAYNDYRRQAAMETIIPMSNTNPFPQRYTYGSDDVTTNQNVAAAYGNGSYVNTEKVWWAGGSR